MPIGSPCLVAHRGVPEVMPENTLIGFEAALRAGARYLELDVQLSGDGVPLLYHDADTARISGVPGTLFDRNLAQIQALRASCPERFGTRFRDTPVATLHEFCSWIATQSDAQVFVELKGESLQRFGIKQTVDTVFQVVGELKQRAVCISFDAEAVQYAGRAHSVRTGWVLPAWTQENAERAAALAPQFLFCDTEILPGGGLWQGPWEWAVYVVDDAGEAAALFRRGIRFIETDNVIDMLDHSKAGGLDSA